MNMTKKEADALVAELRPKAIEIAKQITEFANAHESGRAGSVGGTLASLVLQNILVSIGCMVFEPGSKDGAAHLSDIYHASLRDALERWGMPDLKAAFSARSKDKH